MRFSTHTSIFFSVQLTYPFSLKFMKLSQTPTNHSQIKFPHFTTFFSMDYLSKCWYDNALLNTFPLRLNTFPLSYLPEYRILWIGVRIISIRLGSVFPHYLNRYMKAVTANFAKQLTVRLSLRSCIIKVLSLYASSCKVSSSAIAWSKAYSKQT